MSASTPPAKARPTAAPAIAGLTPVPHPPADPPPSRLVFAAAAKSNKEANQRSLSASDAARLAREAGNAAIMAADTALDAAKACCAKRMWADEQTAVARQLLAAESAVLVSTIRASIADSSVYPTDDSHLEEELETGGADGSGGDGSVTKRRRHGQS
jgi:hypothetical protein